MMNSDESLLKRIEDLTIAEFVVNRSELYSVSRHKRVSEPRQIIMAIAHEAGINWSFLAKKYNRDRVTIYYSAKHIKHLCLVDKIFRKIYNRIKSNVFCNHNFVIYYNDDHAIRVCEKCDYFERVL